MTNAEMIEALRICANQTCCDNCPRYDIDHTQDAQRCCIQLINDAADALEAAGKRIAELEAQLPKDGEWIKKGSWYCCSCCGHEMFFTGIFDEEQRFCYYCGATMRRANDEQDRY